MATELDLFDQLLPASWEGPGFEKIEFPTTKFKSVMAHDLVQHKYWKRNGGRIEDTGVAPIRHTFSLPMINTIDRGKAEKWPDPLYPLHVRRLWLQCHRQATGILTHPEFGELPCKLETFEVDWDAQRRAGVEIEISFIETLVSFDTPNPVGDSPVNDIRRAGESLDASTGDIKKFAPDFPTFTASFADVTRAFQAIGDTAFSNAYRAKGFADNIVYRCDNIVDSLDRGADAMTWPVRDSVERLKSAAHTMQKAADTAFGRPTLLYTTKSDMTVPELSMTLNGAPLTDILRLNPRIAASPVVKSGTLVRYVAARKTG